MSHEIKIIYNPGLSNIYICVFKNDNGTIKVFNVANPSESDWVIWDNNNIGNYSILATEIGQGFYTVSFPSEITDPGRYDVIVFSGDQSSLANDDIVGATNVVWNGSEEIFITDANGRVDVGKVLGEVPEDKTDIAEEVSSILSTDDNFLNSIAEKIITSSDPSSNLIPIFVDTTGRVEISGTKNTLDDLNDIDGSSVTATTISDKTGYSLSSSGLDSISAIEPSGRATTFREMIVQTWMRFFNRVEKDGSEISVYNDADSGKVTTQGYGTVGETTTVEKSSDA